MRYREEPFEYAEETWEVDQERDSGNDDPDRDGTEETGEEIRPCPMCGGRHRGSYCQMPPHEIDYVS